MNKEERHTLARVYADPITPGVRWRDTEQLFVGLGGHAQWSDPDHLTVGLNGVKASFATPKRDKNATLDPADGDEVRTALKSAGIGENMAEG